MNTHQSKELKENIHDLKRLRSTSELSQESLHILASASVKRTYQSREMVWKMGDPGEFIGIIVSGCVEISRHVGSDEETTVGIFGQSDIIGLSATLQKIDYPGTAKILVDHTEIIKCYIRPILSDKKSGASEIQSWIREMILIHEQILRDKIDITNSGTVETRVFELLKHLVRRFGKHVSPVKHFIPIRLTRSQVGNLVDIRPESIIRLISQWQKQNLIRWSTDGIWIENMMLLEKNLSKNKKLK